MKQSTFTQQLNDWAKKEQTYRARYGDELLQDKDYNKAKLAHLREIYQSSKKQSLTADERIDQKVLRARIRQMNRTLYSRPVRLLRSVFNMASAIVKIPVRIVTATRQENPDSHKNVLSQIPFKNNSQASVTPVKRVRNNQPKVRATELQEQGIKIH